MSLSMILAGPIAHTPPAHAVRKSPCRDKMPPRVEAKTFETALQLRSRRAEERIEAEIIEAMTRLGVFAYARKIAIKCGRADQTVINRLPKMLEAGKVEQRPDGKRAGHFVYGLPGMQQAERVQSAVPKVLRPAGDQCKANQAASDGDAGADQIVSRKPARGGNLGAGKGVESLIDRIEALELAIDVFTQSYGKRSKGAALEMLQDVREMGR